MTIILISTLKHQTYTYAGRKYSLIPTLTILTGIGTGTGKLVTITITITITPMVSVQGVVDQTWLEAHGMTLITGTAIIIIIIIMLAMATIELWQRKI